MKWQVLHIPTPISKIKHSSFFMKHFLFAQAAAYFMEKYVARLLTAYVVFLENI